MGRVLGWECMAMTFEQDLEKRRKQAVQIPSLLCESPAVGIAWCVPATSRKSMHGNYLNNVLANLIVVQVHIYQVYQVITCVS